MAGGGGGGVRWGTDYFIGCHKADHEFIGQIGDGYADHAQWDSPENMNIDRCEQHPES